MIKLSVRPTVNKLIAKKIINYIEWLSKNYEFPLQVDINITGAKFVYNSITVEKVIGTFYAPFDKTERSRIKISTGDFAQLMKLHGKEDAIFYMLETISHEIQHYYQWVDDLDFDEEDAEYGATELTTEYMESLKSD
ncbi:hypothetical protein [Enterococcus entomosocium]|uniref:hypothetical protein n=1 Tax=Enterococcus entomosocium TaxID=3034352 RepID=UPI002649E0AE|nr:hypothetical protein [Enterococcus entomosocium]